MTWPTAEHWLVRIRAALVQSGGNQTRAAALLGMRQSNLSRLMKSLGLG